PLQEYFESRIMLKALSCLLILATTPLVADVLTDARQLLDAKNGLVKRWETPPRLVVIHDGRFEFADLDNVLAVLDSATSLGLASQQIPRIDISNSNADPFIDMDFGFRRLDPGLEGQIRLRGGDVYTADIFVFHVPRDWAAPAMILSRSTGTGLARSYMRGRGPCYFFMRSNADGLYLSTIFIDPDMTFSFEDCLYEELAQAMGIMHDVQDTPYFTFDNKPGVVDRTYDLAMLRALYDPAFESGTPVDQVVDRFRDILVGQGLLP
ncbi:MAG: DUF2927 domain-containing protein, partial [Pseudomonadota bacterium]